MGKLIFSAITSVDGYIEDETGDFDWAAPDEEVHAFVNDLERSVGTYLYGRRMYETMVYWETAHSDVELSPVARDFADIWRAANKVVFSRTLKTASSSSTYIVPEFDPDAIRELKSSQHSNLTVGGPELAAHAFRAGLVDECQLFLVPRVVGGGKSALPSGVAFDLELLEERRFRCGVVYLNYRLSSGHV